jgi:hypothetical protein
MYRVVRQAADRDDPSGFISVAAWIAKVYICSVHAGIPERAAHP